MAHCPNNSAPATGSNSARPQESARAQRVNQAQYVEAKLRDGLSPVAVAGVAALLTQLESMQMLPNASLSITTEVASYRRTLTCTNNAWDGHDLTHQFLDERSIAVHGPSQGTRFEQETSLRMMPVNVPSLPSIAAPNPVQTTPHSSSIAYGAPYGTRATTTQNITNQPASSREPSGSQPPAVPNLNLIGRSASEQAVIVALQAVANYPNSSDFVRAVEQRIPGLAHYLQAAAQPSGCVTPPTTLAEAVSMEAETTAGPSTSAMTYPREETGRKRLTEENIVATRHDSVTDSPTSRPPPDKRADVPHQSQMKSVVVVRPPYRVGHLGVGAPQMSLEEAINRCGSVDANPETSPVPSGTGSANMSLEVPETIDETSPPAFLPPSDDVSGTVVTGDSKRIWMAAECLYPNTCAVRRRAPPSDAEQREVSRITIAAQITRSLRARDADLSEQAWEQRAREQLPATPNNYMARLQHDLTEQFPARYMLHEGETWEANARYARNIKSMKPLLKAALQRARYCVAVDSTLKSDLPIDNLLPDVLVLTMPLSRFAEVAEMVAVMYDPNLRGSLREPPPRRVVFTNLIDHMACEGLLRNLDALMADTRRPGSVASLVNVVADAMERAAGILRGRLGALALFASPPGFMYWQRSLQQFVYILSEVCKARRIEFAICAPNLRVDRGDLRPDALSYPAFFAAVSRVLIAVERSGNAQLTIDDAILFDHGMCMGRMAFDLDGNRVMRASNMSEREAVRRYNWLVRKDKEIPVRAELAELVKEIETWPATRTVERTIPQIRFAAGIEPVKLPVGMRYVVAIEATNLKAEVDAAGITYAEWYQPRFVDRTLAEVAQELNCPLEAFCTSLGLGWNIDVIASEYLLTNVQTDKLLETIGEATVGEMLALALAMGKTKFVAGPLAMLVELVVSSDLVTFYSYLILAQGQLRSLTRWGHLLNSKDQQDYVTQLERMRASLQHWLYSTLVFASGLFVGVDQSQPLHHSERQLPAETAGFPMPQQIADLTLAEVEDFVAVMASVLAPIFGAVGVCRYPTKPLARAVQVHMVSFCTYLQGRPPLTYQRIVQAVLSGEMPHGYTTLKSEKQLEENLMGLLRARARKACPLPREYGPVNWYSAPLSLNGVPFRFPWSQEFIRKVIRASTSAGPPVDPLYAFKCITFPNHYWKEPLGWPRAKPVGRAPEAFNRQIQYMELAQIPNWIEGAAQTRQRNLQSRVTPFPRKAAWRPQAKMTMSGDMSIVQHDEINSVLGSEARAEWEGHCLELEIASFPKWKRACELWSQPGWVSKRISLAVESRAELERQQAFAPTMLAPTMAMSLSQPIDRPVTLDLPTHILQAEPVSPPSTQASPQSSQPQTGEHDAELTPSTILMQPIADLTLPEDLSDSETVVTVVPAQRRASIASEDASNPGTPDDAIKNRARRSSAQ